MIVTGWKCGECPSIEDDEKNLTIRIPTRLFGIWSWLEKTLPFDLPELPEESRWISVTKNGTVKVIAMCHHCGKPLCQQHRILIRDEAFSVDEEEIRTLLPTWWPQSVQLKANKNFRFLESQFLSRLPNFHSGYKQLKQKAYHCRNCWQKYHSLAEYEND